MNSLFNDRSYLILDGAVGTQLDKKGFSLHSQLWSATAVDNNPQLLEDIHYDYYCAGANIVTTDSYQITYQGFRNYLGYDDSRTSNTLLLATKLARNAVARYMQNNSTSPCLVAASVGSYGAALADGSEFIGHYDKSVSQLREWHEKRFQILAQSRPDFIACETVPCLDEVKALLMLIAQMDPSSSNSFNSNSTMINQQLVWISASCKSGNTLNSGESIEDFARLVEDDQCHTMSSANSNVAIGINCTSPLFAEECLLSLKDSCSKSRVLVAYPNRGELWNMELKDFEHGSGCSDEQFGQLAPVWHAAGARIIGGCCCTSPMTIKEVKKSLSKN